MANAATSQSNGSGSFSFSKVHSCRIHPGIGVARVGNSPDGYFIGPEAPRDPNQVTAPDGAFKDAEGRIKRQAARFRIYAYDEEGNNLGELPLSGEADCDAGRAAAVEWTVHLANKKGAWYKFFTRFQKPDGVRNGFCTVPKGQPPDSRLDLVIDPGPRCIDGEGRPVACDAGPSTVRFDTGMFLGTAVPLGELMVDTNARLVVLGGFGHSASTNGEPIGQDARSTDYWVNNDHWYDDISDGPVTAKVILPNDGRVITIDQPREAAWVIVAPPKYAPGLDPIVSLYDVMREVALDQKWIADKPNVTYYEDIFPILSRAVGLSWVNKEAQRGHGYDKRGEFRAPEDATPAQPAEQSIGGGMTDPESLDHGARAGSRMRVDHTFLTSGRLAAPQDDKELRLRIVARIRKPIVESTEADRLAPEVTERAAEAARQANARFMPLLSGDGGRRTEGKPETWLSLLPSQYRNFVAWRDDKFTSGQKPTYPPIEGIADPDEQTEALQRGALEPCVGGPFHPGIETSWTVRNPDLYVDAFRIDSRRHRAGDITKYLSVPWQAGFYDCRDTWWPSARPDEVISEEVFEEADKAWRPKQDESNLKLVEGLEGRVQWDRGLGVTTLFRRPWNNPVNVEDDPRDAERRGVDDMVRYWHELGYVVARQTRWSSAKPGAAEYVFIETERRPHAGMDVRELFHCLLNMDEKENRTCLPKVEEFVERVLDASRNLQQTADAFAFMDNIRPFTYDEEIFDARMNDIYDDCADYAFTQPAGNGAREPFDPTDLQQNPVFRTREAITERIRQLTPFNFLDGAWLRNIHRVGPVDEVNSILFTILKEELGDGVPSQNHANIYRDLCHSFGFYPPPMESTAFAYDRSFLDCAFDSPVFQLGISEFSRRYYPEIIGMSLWLEWTVMELHRIASIVEMVKLSSHFYRMHIAIDNAASGHGAAIIRAVKLYLRQIRLEGGEEAVQQHWKRIWDGYVAFAYTFVVVIMQVKKVLQGSVTLEARLQQLIREKAPYGQYNHDNQKLGDSSINAWFANPNDFLKALVKHGAIIPGKPGEGRFFEALQFRGGRMYHVFTEDEIQLWRDWTIELAQEKRWGSSLQSLRERLSKLNPLFAAHVTDAELETWQRAAVDHRVGLWLELASKEVLGTVQASESVPTAEELKAISDSIHSRFTNWVGWGMIRAVTHVAALNRKQLEGVELSLPDAHGKPLTLSEWLDRICSAANSAGPARDMLQSLGRELTRRRTLANELFGADTRLGFAFNSCIPGNDGRRGLETMEAWLAVDCPLPNVPRGRVKPLRLDASLNEEECHPTGLIMGFGTVH
ncbi:LodA/GoxA family CTQ-dependent oxidase [Bradyrhizobium sp. BRP22]|uniref:LodA/GoxA family CTQ-dependent oxidase n=1 Tax=Bradyrhizobium sp. BRP22 TaxID=2793821 RepID=UPI001CD41839|nr:LodA/GoxA family CTQ-dependent oxidase [Bradyrhizobium sp. BRP22]MCA1458772.1 LodA/GoxA family CTQ-dependent oxidase [Bradyrhizobium sp. BRP22]